MRVVESAPTDETGQDRVVDVSCPTGMRATGGGGEVFLLDDLLPKPQITGSHPIGSDFLNPTTWEVQAWSAVPAAHWQLRAWVMCAQLVG
jgi:hypothetical protein